MGEYKERLLMREKAIAEGHYPDLELKKEDPIKWEMLISQLSGLLDIAKAKLRNISASPICKEAGEALLGLFTPEGDSVVFSLGIALHVRSMGSTIKWMLMNDYEEVMGIREGDHFFNNDPYIAGAHAADQVDATPIFYDGTLIGWACALTHVGESGGTEPGGQPSSAQSIYDEGLRLPCMRIAENDVIRPDVEIMVERDTRKGLYWNIDARARAAGTILVRESIKELVKKYGLDYYLKAIYEYIEHTRRTCREKIKKCLFPGTYRFVQFGAVPFKEQNVRKPKDYLWQVPLELKITPEGDVFLDYEGASHAGLHPCNCSIHCAAGVAVFGAYQELFFDLTPNQGIAQVIVPEHLLEQIFPQDSVLNPPRDYACGHFRAGQMVGGTLILCLSHSFFSAGFREEVSSGIPLPSAMTTGGKDQYGDVFVMASFEDAGSGMPAMAALDGLDTAFVVWNPESDFGNAEFWEQSFPQVWLGRRIFPDGGGFGKFRGGNGIESLYLMVNSDHIEMGSRGAGSKVFHAPGIMGGYPGTTNAKWIVRGTNIKKLIEKKLPIPHSEGHDPSEPSWNKLIKGEPYLVNALTVTTELDRYDLWQQINGHGGGFGDPIDRDPQLVKKDLERNFTSMHTARKVYGVEINADSLEIDHKATEELRQKIREMRKARGKPAKEYHNEQRKMIMDGVLSGKAKEFLNEDMKFSKKFLKEFKDFWELPDDFKEIK